jgi:hypothetical protein
VRRHIQRETKRQSQSIISSSQPPKEAVLRTIDDVKIKAISTNPESQDVPRKIRENLAKYRVAEIPSRSPPIKVVTDSHESQATRAYILTRDYNEFTSAFAGKIDRIYTYKIVRTPYRYAVLSTHYGDEKNLHEGVLRDIYSFSDSAFAQFVDFTNQRNGEFISVDPN